MIVDFLIPPSDESDQPEQGSAISRRILAAIIIPGLDLAFLDQETTNNFRQTSSFTGIMPLEKFLYAARAPFTVLKALAFGNRSENKDAYDLFYLLNGLGAQDHSRAPFLPLSKSSCRCCLTGTIERDFSRHDGIGPIAVATFLPDGPNDEIQADVVGQAQLLLRSVAGP